MDAHSAAVRLLTLPGVRLGLLAGVVLLAGCGRASAPDESPSPAPAAHADGQKGSTVTATGRDNVFRLDDPQGRRVLEAEADLVEGTMRPGIGFEGDVVFRKVRARLFREGEPQIDLETPEARWDGERLISDQKTLGTSPDGLTKIEAARAVWTAKSGELALETARVEALPEKQGPEAKTSVIHARKALLFGEEDETRAEDARLESLRAGKLDFTVTASRALVNDNIATMPAGATGRSADGGELKGDRVRWNMDTGDLVASGNVVLTTETATMTGRQMNANTELKRGRVTGGARVVTRPAASSGSRTARPR